MVCKCTCGFDIIQIFASFLYNLTIDIIRRFIYEVKYIVVAMCAQ